MSLSLQVQKEERVLLPLFYVWNQRKPADNGKSLTMV